VSCAFTVAHYRELLGAARSGGYRFSFFDSEPQEGDLVLRHDVDLSLEAALALAEVEAELGVQSTWFLMTRSVFYNLDSPAGQDAVERLRALGHRVAHHAVWPNVDLDARFDALVAWHNPDPEYMSAPVAGAVNVMSAPWFDPARYRSDSNARWRHGCPHDALAAGEFPWLQLLVHPEIWVYEGETMGEKMRSFLAADQTVRRDHLRDDRIELA